MASPEHKKAKGTSQFEKFDALFSVLNEDLTKQGLKDGEIADAMAYFKKVISIFLCSLVMPLLLLELCK